MFKDIIHIAWFQGAENTPPLVQMCLNRWARLNPDYDVRIYDLEDTLSILSATNIDLAYFLKNYNPNMAMCDNPDFDSSLPALSELLRVWLLKTLGGVWADATTFPVIPLADWLPTYQKSGFFCFDGHQRPIEIGCWFLYAKPDNALVCSWWQEVESYWAAPRTHSEFAPDLYSVDFSGYTDKSLFIQNNIKPYFWLHYLFSFMIRNDEVADRLFREVKMLPSAHAHAVQFRTISNPCIRIDKLKRLAQRSPVQKLNRYKTDLHPIWIELDSVKFSQRLFSTRFKSSHLTRSIYKRIFQR